MDTSALIYLVAWFLISITFSFLCSILEAVLLSITPAYAQAKLAEGSTTGKLIEEYKRDIDRPLSAVLTLNTIAHTVGAIGVGAQAANVYGSGHTIPFLGLDLSFEFLVSAVMTLAILIASEIIPKTIGANNWENLAPFTVRTLRIMLILLAPLVWLSQLITRFLKKDKESSVFSRTELVIMSQIGAHTTDAVHP